MRIILATLILALLPSSLGSQTLLGNCTGGTVDVQLTTGNVYCTPPSGSCSNSLNFTEACNTQFFPLFRGLI